MNVTVDQKSGYCFGVEYAIQIAEDEMEQDKELFCLGDIVHNDMEVQRLHKKGLRIIDHEKLNELHNCKVLIRAHGEPPETYAMALKNNIELVDASCPVVLKLQNRVKHAYDKMQNHDGQVVIYGKTGHAEVIGLAGQTNDDAIIISKESDLDKIDFSRPAAFFSQTTKSTKGFYALKDKIKQKFDESSIANTNNSFEAHDSICRQVSNREPNMQVFAKEQDVVLFVSGKKSSNGKALYKVCKTYNDRSYFIENISEVNNDWFRKDDAVGICGATSTPMWLMKDIAEHILKSVKKHVEGK